MNLLLDTHIILWWLDNSPQLSAQHTALIADLHNLCFISAASIWEINIKRALGKLEIPHDCIHELRSEGFIELPVTWEHADRVQTLPAIHQDPFDRILIAQAMCNRLTLVTADRYIQRYPVETA